MYIVCQASPCRACPRLGALGAAPPSENHALRLLISEQSCASLLWIRALTCPGSGFIQAGVPQGCYLQCLPRAHANPRWAQDFFNTSVMTDSANGRFIQVGKGTDATEVGENIALLQRNTLCRVSLVADSPGAPGIKVQAAVFERWDYAGSVWVSTSSLEEALALPPGVGGWKWWQKKKSSIETMRGKFDLGRHAVRPAMPFKAEDRSSNPERCLPFSSLSVGALLLLALRSGSGATKRAGAIESAEGAAAFRQLFRGLVGHVPKECFLLGVRHCIGHRALQHDSLILPKLLRNLFRCVLQSGLVVLAGVMQPASFDREVSCDCKLNTSRIISNIRYVFSFGLSVCPALSDFFCLWGCVRHGRGPPAKPSRIVFLASF